LMLYNEELTYNSIGDNIFGRRACFSSLTFTQIYLE
jgi:hypothetical protein